MSAPSSSPLRLVIADDGTTKQQGSTDVAQLLTARLPERVAARLPPRLIGERGRRLYFLDPEQIDFIESDGNYVTLHAGSERFLMRNTLKRLSVTLAAWGFLRIERRILVNWNRVHFAESAGNGEYAFTVQSGAQVQSSASYRDLIRAAMEFGRSSTA